MALGADIRAGAAYVELVMRDRRFLAGLTKAQARLNAFSAGAMRAGMGMIRLAAVMAAPFAIGAKIFADFEQQMAKVQTMVDEPQKHMERFRKEVRSMSMEFGQSTETISKGLYDILSATIPAEHALEFLREGMKAAIGGFTDADTSISALLTLMHAYGNQLTSVADATDFLQSVVKRGRVDYERLAENLGKVAPSAAAVGVSLEEFGAALALVTRGMPDTENATTALANVIETFMKNTDDAKKFASELGIEMNTAGIKSKGLLYVIQQLAKVDPDTIAKVFPRRRALRGLVIAVQHAGDLATDIEYMRNRAGRMQSAYEIATATMAHGFAQAKQSFVGLFAAIGEAVAGPVRAGTEAIIRFVRGLTDWIKNNKQIVQSVMHLAIVIGGIGAGMVAFALAVKAVAFSLGGLAVVLGLVKTAFGLVAAAVGFLLTPFGIISAAIIGLGAMFLDLGKIGGKVGEWLGNVFSELAADAKASWSAIADALAAGDIAAAAKVVWAHLKLLWTQGKTAVLSIWSDLWTSFQLVVAKGWYGVQSLIVKAWAGLQSIWAKTLATMRSGWVIFTTGIKSIWENIGAWIEKRWNDIRGAFDESFDAEAANRAVEAARSTYQTEIFDEMTRQLNDITRDEADRLAAIQKERATGLDAINREAANATSQILSDYMKENQQAKAELEAARTALEEARKNAQAAARKKGATAEELDVPGVTDALKNLTKRMDKAGESLAASSSGIAGGFRVGVLQRQVGGRQVLEDIAAEQKKGNKLAKQSLDEFKRVFPNAPAFA